MVDKETDVIAKTIRYSCWARYAEFSDSPEYRKKHDEMREHLIEVAGLSPATQVYLARDISEIIQTLHMSRGDYESALREVMKNDPEGRKIIMDALEIMASKFQDWGFAVLPKDFLKGVV